LKKPFAQWERVAGPVGWLLLLPDFGPGFWRHSLGCKDNILLNNCNPSLKHKTKTICREKERNRETEKERKREREKERKRERERERE
jgi:hypothetical protein